MRFFLKKKIEEILKIREKIVFKFFFLYEVSLGKYFLSIKKFEFYTKYFFYQRLLIKSYKSNDLYGKI